MPTARQLVVTELLTVDAARARRTSVAEFIAWAHRRGVRPVRRVRVGRSTYAVWDADQVLVEDE